jgi:hypothetical protein
MKKLVILSLLASSMVMANDSLEQSGVNDIIFDKGHFEVDARLAFTSFEEPVVIYFGSNDPGNLYANSYSSSGMPCVAHDLVNDADTHIMVVDTGPFVTDEISVDASFTPKLGCDDNDPNFPDDGLRFDFTGGTNNTFYLTNSTATEFYDFTDGEQGYEIHDVDGIIKLETGEINLLGRENITVGVDYFFNDRRSNGSFSGWEADDSLRIYAKNLDTSAEYELVNLTGGVGGIEGESFSWQSSVISLPDNVRVNIIIEGSNDSGDERIFIDNLEVRGL